MQCITQQMAGIATSMSNTENNKIWFSQGIEKYMDSLYSIACRLTRNQTDAEDLVAESITKAWASFPSLQDRSKFRPWLFRILHNCFISDYRKKSVRPLETAYDETLINEDEEEISELLIRQPNAFMHWWANPEKEFINRLLGEHILKAIDSLPEVFRTTILLVNVEGFSYDDAADVLGVPSGTIRSRMKRGRTLLQKGLWQLAKEEGLINDDTQKGNTDDK